MSATDSPRGPLQITLDSAAQLATTRARVRTWLAEALDRDEIDDTLLATGEARANAFEHGEPPVDLDIRWSEPQTLLVTDVDAGLWTLSACRLNRGRGIPIMTALGNNFTVNMTSGTTVRVKRTFHQTH